MATAAVTGAAAATNFGRYFDFAEAIKYGERPCCGRAEAEGDRWPGFIYVSCSWLSACLRLIAVGSWESAFGVDDAIACGLRA